MGKRTPLYERHRAAGARLVDFAGWDMPVNFGSQIEEHHAVRQAAGMFDVSHMTQVDIDGPDAEAYLQRICANDVGRAADGQATYTCLLNEAGGVIDDGIVYRLAPARYRLVVNAATRERDLEWLQGHAEGFDTRLEERSDLAMIAIQGPQARERVHALLPDELAQAAPGLKRFRAVEAGAWLVGRTGYTGEDGYEVMLPGDEAGSLWDGLREADVQPCGLGARDTLRLEAGMALYGQDMDEQVSPLEAGLGWTIAWEPAEREFIGRAALEAQRADGVERRLDGLVLEGKGVARAHYAVITDAGEGEITSGGFAPTLGRSIALARIPADAAGDCQVVIRGRHVPARITGYPFVRNGQPRI